MKTLLATLVLASTFFLSGCNFSQIRVLHASPDAPAVDVHIEKGKPIKGLAYGAASGFVHSLAGTRQIQVKASGTDFVVIDVNPSLEAMASYTVLAVDYLDQIEPLLLVDNLEHPAEGFLKVRVVHAAPAAPAVDIYVTAPNTPLPASPTIEGLEFKAATDYLEIPAADYQVRVTAEDSSAIIFDSGKLALSAGSNLTLAALETDQGSSPIKLTALTLDPKKPSFDIDDQRARVKVIHASPDAPAVDVLLNEVVVLEAVPFGAASNYLTVPSGEQQIKVNVAGTDTRVIDVTPDLQAGSDYSVLATNFVSEIAPLLLEDDNSAPTPGTAGIRVIHAAPDAPAVDVLVDGNLAISSLEYQAATDFIFLPSARYDISVNVADTSTTVIDAELNLAAGSLTTVIAIGSVSEGTLAPLVLTEMPE